MATGLDRVFVIGIGEVGRRLAGALSAAGVEVVPVTRDAGWERAAGGEAGVRLVCVREEALGDVLARLAAVEPRRLAFVQNGWVRPLLAHVRGCTRGLVWFTSKGEFFRVLRDSPFSGPVADEIAAALVRGGIAASAVHEGTFAALDVEKMGFNCVVGLPLAVHGLSLGDYLRDHRDEAEALFGESVTACARALGVPVGPGWWDAFLGLAEPLAWVRARAAKALDFRNGAVLRLARERGVDVPVTRRLLAAVRYPA